MQKTYLKRLNELDDFISILMEYQWHGSLSGSEMQQNSATYRVTWWDPLVTIKWDWLLYLKKSSTSHHQPIESTAKPLHSHNTCVINGFHKHWNTLEYHTLYSTATSHLRREAANTG